MTAKPKARSKCKHPELDKKLRCKMCGALVDIRGKRNKYGARRTDGFDSAKEAGRFQVLAQLANTGEISGFERQRRFPLEVNGQHICEYVSDFDYFDGEGKQVVEDVKPSGKAFKKTAAYRIFQIKKRLMLACHGIEVQEV